MSINEGLFTSKSSEWETPQDLFDALNEEFGFEVDVCATPFNAKCDTYFTVEDDGLSKGWPFICWMNPPYGQEIGQWVAHAHIMGKKGAVVVCLLPARTDTRWWHEHVMQATEIRFIRGRLKFGGATNSAPFPSAIVVFDWLAGRAIPTLRSVGKHGRPD